MAESSNYFSYSTFMTISKTLDRDAFQLPEDSIRILYSIKKKLNIKDLNNIKYYELCEKPKFKSEDEVLNNLYKYLNKITDKTYDKLSKEIMQIIDELAIENNEQSKIIFSKFFDIISNNSICCDIYVKLYNDICNKHEEFKGIFREQIQVYLNEHKSVKYISPNDDYDQYCEHVKKLDKMKNFTIFLAKSFAYLICSLEDIVEVLLYFQKRCIDLVENENFASENEQVANTIYLILREILDSILFHESWETIKKNQLYLTEYKGPGKSNKMKFKLMDIEDIIRKSEE